MNIIVTGASKGIGKSLVKFFSNNKQHKVLAVSRDISALKELQNTCTYPVQILSFDITKCEDDNSLLEKVKALGSIDVIINNAGLLINKPLTSLNGHEFDKLFNVNVKAVFLLTKQLLPYLRKGSHIVNIGSMGGYQGSSKYAGLSLYSASKGALAILTECMAEELKPQVISANCLALGAVQTEMLSEAFPDYKAPLSPDEIASFIADFALKGHRFFNGKIVPVSVSSP